MDGAETARSMPTRPDFFNDPKYWRRRAEEARMLAEQMSGELAKQTMLTVAADCESFAVRAATRHFDELAVRCVIKGS